MKSKIPYILLAIFTLLLLAGIIHGEVNNVIETAVIVCLSCIGIG